MAGIRITCGGCHRSWTLPVDDSVYLELDIESRPCPYCEACTLTYHDGAHTARPPRRRRRRGREAVPPSLRSGRVGPAVAEQK